jgi:hypothetical protein
MDGKEFIRSEPGGVVTLLTLQTVRVVPQVFPWFEELLNRIRAGEYSYHAT